ncbi:SH3 domain-containing protein [Shimia gijangensis]|uniref:SH3 domain-containing protein n=1 Tax=Shimia gijangensis TaxID=1470563 RepID=A0A1M6ML73_9RHOB|nr:SH3 domain-containing protein [Shimia gijangensis]SHJ84245.1 SH3 domain-containing protein [Shimia gijangensis]
MKNLLFLIFWIFSPAILLASEFPLLFDVTDVASDDVLNVREDPSPNSEIWGTIAFNERNVEVIGLSEDRKWGQINSGEISGWVSMRYLSPVPDADWFLSSAQLRCGGTEPFWDMTMNAPSQGVASFQAMVEETPRVYSIDWHGGQIARMNNVIGLGGRNTDGPNGFSAVIRRTDCHDGMSDMSFGLAIDLFLHGDGAPEGYEGCCSIRP